MIPEPELIDFEIDLNACYEIGSAFERRLIRLLAYYYGAVLSVPEEFAPIIAQAIASDSFSVYRSRYKEGDRLIEEAKLRYDYDPGLAHAGRPDGPDRSA